MECRVCHSNSGEQRISPGATIHEGRHWLVEHAYPVSRTGWLVIVLKRHAEALHELTAEEFAELAGIQARATHVLHETLKSQKEYVACYAETEHFHHMHFHVFAKPHDLPREQWGGGSFAIIKVSEQEAIPRQELADFCSLLAGRW
jgi:diadenosine tetraphosphate (Ap4A) HIT family hydrolase